MIIVRIATFGVGSIGTIVGALLTKSGHKVDMFDVLKENVDALNQNGATIIGSIDVHVPVRAFLPSSMEGTYDLVILMTKQTSNAEALPTILPHLRENSTVCTLQNGIPEESVAFYVGKDRTVGGTVGFGATWVRPGVSSLTSDAGILKNYALDIGEISGEITPRIKKIQEVLGAVGGTTVMANLMSIRWSKLLMNATFSGMSAALGCTFGDVLDNPKAMFALAHIAKESIEVCHSQGHKMTEINGLDMERLAIDRKADIPARLPLYHQVWEHHRPLKASMLQDLEKGRPCEIDFINGVVVKNGQIAGIPTPFNNKVVELVKEAEARKGVNDMTYLNRFDDIIAVAK